MTTRAILDTLFVICFLVFTIQGAWQAMQTLFYPHEEASPGNRIFAGAKLLLAVIGLAALFSIF